MDLQTWLNCKPVLILPSDSPYKQKCIDVGIPVAEEEEEADVVAELAYTGTFPVPDAQVLSTSWLEACFAKKERVMPRASHYWKKNPNREQPLPSSSSDRVGRRGRVPAPPAEGRTTKRRSARRIEEEDTEYKQDEEIDSMSSQHEDHTRANLPVDTGSRQRVRVPKEAYDPDGTGEIAVLKKEIFPRFGSKMPLWPEDNPGGTGGGYSFTRPPFPLELTNVQKATNHPSKRQPFTPEEDYIMINWMMRAFPLFDTPTHRLGFGLTSFQSPCLWHWAEQFKLTRRGWESMKTRSRLTLEPMIKGQAEIPHELLERMRENDLFVLDGNKLTAYNKELAVQLNEDARANPMVELIINSLDPPPAAVPTRKRRFAKPGANGIHGVSGVLMEPNDPIAIADPVIHLEGDQNDHGEQDDQEDNAQPSRAKRRKNAE